MTDRDRLTGMLDDFGVKYIKDDEYNTIECHSGDEKIEGYIGFFTFFEFTEDGAFKSMGASE